jgi:hypothetical protein
MPIDLALADAAATIDSPDVDSGDVDSDVAAAFSDPVRPGDAVRLNVAWDIDAAPARIEVRLVYRTAGKGTTDVVCATTNTQESPANSGRRIITLTLPPDAPLSYDGKLLSISWFAQAELIGTKKRVTDTAELPLIVSPIGRPITPQHLTGTGRIPS